ncbi:ParA protein, putative (plasmid) [Shewanella baltica OS223]|uniref:ParA protein, putative n=2 Tax=Shewanella TaxID=22 RepID=A9L6R0_SHEB9|nr:MULTISPECIES: ParA family protein [Shewanella]ABX51842.1 ParA protein, putative [Shewanella baltica OS195]ACK48811.1 ParA protein, putative [Shewanella baltica OS223]MCT7948070.1 ParA family protein [Shewanella septentrionalis]
MTVIAFAQSKGGAGKTTACVTLAGELCRQASESGIKITLIDTDPNQHSAGWAKKNGCPSNLVLIEKSTEDTVLDDIETASSQTQFVLVDLEGTANFAVTQAISRADLVIVPCQGSEDDASEAARTIGLIRKQGRLLGRKIPCCILLTRTSAAIQTRLLKLIKQDFIESGVHILNSSLIDREAFRAVRSYGGTVNNLDPALVSGTDKAAINAKAYANDVKRMLLEVNNG